MKRKLLALAILLASASAAHAQVLISLLFGDKLNSDAIEFGLQGGVNWSTVSEMQSGNALGSFNLGFYFDVRLKEPWYLSTGVMVKARHGLDKLKENDLEFLQADTYTEPGTYSQRINYFIVPALLRYKTPSRVYVEAGPQFGLMHQAWIQYDSEVDDREARIRQYNKDEINRLDVGVSAGVGYKLSEPHGMTLGMNYYYGFANVYKGLSGSNIRSFFLKACIPIGAKKAETADK